MFDIDFYRNLNGVGGYDYLEGLRNRKPVVFNIETTNACNMRCKMCPRTTLMTRPVTTMKPDLFERIIDQVTPFSDDQWAQWENFVQEKYGISPDEMSENHFFLYVIPKVITLHGHGEPILDKNMPGYVKMLAEHGLQSYFSCNPANIDIPKTIEMFENGLGYIKYSTDSFSNFNLDKIYEVLEIKKQRNLKTIVVITMIDLAGETQKEEYAKLKSFFRDRNVYFYLKSENSQWYRKDYHGTKSIHWTEPCKHPWMSMSISSDGKATTCMSDYNNEIILGDAKTESLSSIWNGELYDRFRRDHLEMTEGIRCTDHCDMRIMGESC